MGRRGPPRKPTWLRVVEGNPGKRPLNTLEPRPPTDPRMRCPSWLDPEAKRLWRRLVPDLCRARIVTVVDREVLIAYCQAWSRWRKAEEFIQKRGEVYPVRASDGRIISMAPFPQVAIARQLLQALRGLQQELGLTPSARTRLEIEPQREPSELDKFLEYSRRVHARSPDGE